MKGIESMKKIISLILVLTMSFVALTGCGGETKDETKPEEQNSEQSEKPDKDEKIKLKFMGWGNDAEVETFKAMIAQFEEQYKNVEVDYTVVPSSDYDTKLQNMISANDQPDVFYISVDNVMKYAATDNLYDLTTYVNDNDIFDVENIWENAINIYKYDGTGLDVIDFVKRGKVCISDTPMDTKPDRLG